MSAIVKTVAALSLVPGVMCSWGWGYCNGNKIAVGKVNGMDFDATKYAGLWYEIKRDKDVWYEQNSDCVTAYYTSHPEELIYKIYVNNGSKNKDTGELSNGYVFGIGTDITTAKARFDEEGYGHV